ncbi:MAG: hypothetical protein JW955_16990 [Sedimentisphaerales bacterium]|nr:hypothetical protein [Sedimentisphaerales bacterium]
MRLRDVASSCVLVTLAAAMLVGGCAAPRQPRLDICPGQASVDEALAVLADHARQATAFRANGQILLAYHEPDSKKGKRHNLSMQLWFDPPRDIYIQGSVGLDPRAVIIGSNNESFWLALRPKEVSSYYLGRWEDARDVEGLVMSPKVVLEAFGVALDEEPNEGRWSLKNEGAFDVLTRRDLAGRLVRRLYVYACDRSIRKAEYFDDRQKVIAVAEFDEYKPVTERFRVPTRVRVTGVGPSKREDSIDITLSSLTAKRPNALQKKILFNPPDADKFERLYTLVDAQWVRRR